jgi:TonB family protein
MTLAQVLTQRLPALDSLNKATLPPGIQQPFQEIIANCLEADPSRRWTAEQISARLAGPSASARAVPTPSTPIEGKKQSTRWVYVIPLIVVIVLAILFFPRSKAPEAKPPAQPAQRSPAERTPVGGGAGSANSSSAPATTQDCCDGRVATRMMPQISAGAQRTIQGKIRVQIDLTVDETGKVTDARFKSAGPSRYFAERAMEAARQWTFKPPVENGQALASEWRVKFLIGRRTIDDSAEQIRP